ncbi:hypothetical protein HUJ04_000930 [Dendroctonus ponderosae]|nr:hypothetical protein HUJ04_000930 [Dendroctonus ponderosae]KAH1018475.1 hypothetical protein HUJ05_006240 [Dendroctonus ponderosae]
MKFAVFAFVCLLSTFVSAEEVEELGYDWDNIKSLDIFVEPIGPAEYVPPQAGLRIIGGNVAARNAFPYQAALIINNSGFCGGSIISNQWVLTAAHCVDTASSVQLILGAHNPSTTVNEPTQVRVVANARVVHTGWNGNTMQNDIALLRAASIPVGSSGISSVSLAPASSGTFAGSTAVLSGWGRTSDASNSIAAELRTVQLPIITNAVCANSYGTIITNQIICTSGAGNRGACNEPIGPAEYVPPQAGLRVINGNVAARGAFPYQAALIINNSGFCGGSIISNLWVLTAAHCVDTASSVQVILGAHNPRTTVNEPTQVRLAANARVVHTGWTASTLQNDIAVLRTANIPVGQTGISTIALAPANSGTFAGSTAVFSGWGRTSDASTTIANELKTVQLPVITNAVCASAYGSIITTQILCTSGAGNRGACSGDSGGPLVINGAEVGIASFAARQCAAGHPTGFVRVSFFRNWIASNSGV